MKTISREQLTSKLRELGIKTGSKIMVHSAVQYLGTPLNGLGEILDSFTEVLGSEGTLVVPAFSFEFAKSKIFDPATTPSTGMGVFSEFVRQIPGAVRTLHPMQSVAVIGRDASRIESFDTLSAFDDGSAFDFMLTNDYKILLLGASIQAVSLVHYSEQRAKVPYRYWKDFPGMIRIDSTWENRTYKMFVRDMVVDPKLNLTPIESKLKKSDNWLETSINYGKASLFSMVSFRKSTDEILKDNPWGLVEK